MDGHLPQPSRFCREKLTIRLIKGTLQSQEEMQRKKPLGSGLEKRERRRQNGEVGDGPDVDCEGPGAGRISTAALENWLDFC